MFKYLVLLSLFFTGLFANWGNENAYGIQKHSFEDTIKHKRALSCNEMAKAGYNKPERYRVNIGNSKTIGLKIETYVAKDRILVEYGEKTIFDSGCIGSQGWNSYKIKTTGYYDYVHVTVLPNCKENQPTTQWKFILNCK